MQLDQQFTWAASPNLFFSRRRTPPNIFCGADEILVQQIERAPDDANANHEDDAPMAQAFLGIPSQLW